MIREDWIKVPYQDVVNNVSTIISELSKGITLKVVSIPLLIKASN